MTIANRFDNKKKPVLTTALMYGELGVSAEDRKAWKEQQRVLEKAQKDAQKAAREVKQAQTQHQTSTHDKSKSSTPVHNKETSYRRMGGR
jgi:hypothetical protein